MTALVAATAVAVASATASISATAAGPSLATGVVLAKAYVKNHYRIDGLYGVIAKRSKRNARFALVNGYFRRPRKQPNLWTVYLRAADGRWRIHYAGVGAKAIEPKIRVPCDIWPPFAEALC